MYLNILLIQDCPTIQWYAVYDGHGGLDSAIYSSKQLHLNFAKQEDFVTDVPQALKSSILKTDQDFCAKAKIEVRPALLHVLDLSFITYTIFP